MQTEVFVRCLLSLIKDLHGEVNNHTDTGGWGCFTIWGKETSKCQRCGIRLESSVVFLGDLKRVSVPRLTFAICKSCKDIKISQGMSVKCFELLELDIK